jgi:hypothetical protein
VPPIADAVEARPAVIIAAALPSMMHDRVRSLFTFKLIARAPFWQRAPNESSITIFLFLSTTCTRLPLALCGQDVGGNR